MKTGDIIICVIDAACRGRLTIGKRYKIMDYNRLDIYKRHILEIINDEGNQLGYHIDRFIPDVRQEKLKRILNER